MTVNVRYRCKCMDVEAEIEVRHRLDEEDIKEWMEEVLGRALFADHKIRSPDCTSTKTEYVKIYIPPGAPYLGGKSQVN